MFPNLQVIYQIMLISILIMTCLTVAANMYITFPMFVKNDQSQNLDPGIHLRLSFHYIQIITFSVSFLILSLVFPYSLYFSFNEQSAVLNYQRVPLPYLHPALITCIMSVQIKKKSVQITSLIKESISGYVLYITGHKVKNRKMWVPFWYVYL